MHILYLTGESLGETGGATTHIMELSRSFQKLGHKVTIVAHKEQGTPTVGRLGGFRVLRANVKAFGKTLPFLNTRLLPLVRKEKCDIILERYGAFGGTGTLLSKLLKLPLVLEVNGPHIDEAVDLGQLNNSFLEKALRLWSRTQFSQASLVLFPAACVTDTYKKLFLGEYASKGHYIDNGVNLDAFQKNKVPKKKIAALQKKHGLGSSLVFTFIGSFKPWMGVIDLVKAVRHLRDNHLSFYKKCSFLLVGSGREYESVRSYAKEHDLDRCIFVGSVPMKHIPLYLRASHVGVAPFNLSHHVTLQRFGFYYSPIKLFEYMAFGLPIISTNCAEIKKLVGKGGVCVPESNPKKLAEAFVAMGNKNKRDAMGKYNSTRVKKQYTWDHTAQEQIEMFEGILRK